MEAGLNLYSIRCYLDTEEHFLGAALQLKEMGYRYLQYSGGEMDFDRIARVSRAGSLPIVLTHAPLDRILQDTDRLMEEHERIGCRRIGLGAMPMEVLREEERCKGMIAELERAAEHMSRNGFTFFYHHHHMELHRYGGQTILSYLIEQAPHVQLTLDTYWLQYGGVDIASTVQRLTGRIECVHLKDYRVALREDGSGFEPRFAPVGDGNIDFAAILPLMRRAGTKYFLVEQDDAANLPDPMGQVERSIRYITQYL